MSEKIATKIKIGLTGQVYNIGTVGTQEKVSVTLTAGQGTSWTGKSITVQNISASTSETVNIDNNGQCDFSVPIGNMYSITFPIVSGYNQPAAQTITASQATRSINVSYNTLPILYDTLIMTCKLTSKTATIASVLGGQTVYVHCSSGEDYATTFSNTGTAQISVPYGKQCTLHLPTIAGFYHDHTTFTYTSGIVSRQLMVNYIEETLGVCAITSDGTYYDLDSLDAALTAGTIQATDVVAGSYNDHDLVNAYRRDGFIGCGFCWNIAGGSISGVWNGANIGIDTSLMPYCTSDANGMLTGETTSQACGAYFTNLMVQYATGGSTTVATTCQATTLTINGVTRNGFLPAYGQIRRLVIANTDYTRLYTILANHGRILTKPNITSGGWWTSCQNSATNGMRLDYGGFNPSGKSGSNSVFVAFDL